MEKYFVVSYDGECPAQIFFKKEDAFATQARYVDSFDVDGKHVDAYMAVFQPVAGTFEFMFTGYTTDF